MYLNAFLVGATYGLTICSWSCLPYIAPYVMGSQGGFAKGVRTAMFFSFGKLLSYAALGTIAGYLGSVLSGDFREIFQKISALVILWLGGTLFFKGKSKCGKNKHGVSPKNQDVFKILLLGITAGLVPCLPMSGILLYACNKSALDGGLIVSAFGLGTMISPLIIISGGMGWLSKNIGHKIPTHSLLLRRICGLILLGSGIKVFFSTVALNYN